STVWPRCDRGNPNDQAAVCRCCGVEANREATAWSHTERAKYHHFPREVDRRGRRDRSAVRPNRCPGRAPRRGIANHQPLRLLQTAEVTECSGIGSKSMDVHACSRRWCSIEGRGTSQRGDDDEGKRKCGLQTHAGGEGRATRKSCSSSRTRKSRSVVTIRRSASHLCKTLISWIWPAW